MAYKRCGTCSGSGRMMGGGMMQIDCEQCDGKGKLFEPQDPITYLEEVKIPAKIDIKEMKKSESYKKAKANLKKKLSSGKTKPTDAEIEDLLDQALGKED